MGGNSIHIWNTFQAKLAASAISDAPSEETSEGEITSDNNKSQKSEAEEDKAEKTEEEQDDHEQAKRALDKSSSPKDPDDPNGGPSNAGNYIFSDLNSNFTFFRQFCLLINALNRSVARFQNWLQKNLFLTTKEGNLVFLCQLEQNLKLTVQFAPFHRSYHAPVEIVCALHEID